jgi:hypothetical protein
MPIRKSIRNGCDTSVLFRHAMLDFGRAADGIDRTGEFDQHAVAGGLDDAPAMFGDGRIDDRFADGLEPDQRTFLAGPHQAAITYNIRRQHGSKPPLHPLVAQDRPFGSVGSPDDLTARHPPPLFSAHPAKGSSADRGAKMEPGP